MDMISMVTRGSAEAVDAFVALVAQRRLADKALIEELDRAARRVSMSRSGFLVEVRSRIARGQYNDRMLGSMSEDARELFKVEAHPALVP